MTEKERAGMEKLRAAMELDDRMLLEENPPMEGDIRYSKAYLANIERLKPRKKKLRLNIPWTFGKRVAAVILMVLALSGSLMSISAVREPIVGFFVNVQARMLEIFFPEDKKTPTEIETVYTLAYLPEDCEWLTQAIGEKEVTTTWISDMVTVSLVQTTLDSRLFVNNEFARFEVREIAEKNMAVIERFDLCIYFWNSHDYAYQLVVQGIFCEEDCIRMIESLQIDPTIQIGNGENET